MPEYISREAVKAAFASQNKSLQSTCYSVIDSIPAADVAQVVRCKDCEHRIFVEVGDVGQIGGCDIFGCAMQSSSFCSYGKRKEAT